MAHEQQHYVNGEWVEPLQPVLLDVIDPSTEEAFTQIAVGGPKDVDRAVAAARAAFPSFCPHLAQGSAGSVARHSVRIQQAASGHRRVPVAGNGRAAEVRAAARSPAPAPRI